MSDITLHPTERELEAVRARLTASRGRQFWRSLQELADSPAFRQYVGREFPRGAAELDDPLTRRTFLKLAGASLALAGLSGCTTAMKQPQEEVAPFARAPLEQTPGIPLFYATTLSRDGFGLGVAVKNWDGRPTKIEGNPQHPASLGATDAFTQAEILSLYDPDRPESVLNRGLISTWDQFVPGLNEVLLAQRALGGSGLRILTSTVTSPTLASQMGRVLELFPNARWVQYDPVGRSNVYEGARLAFGEPVEPRYNFAEARVIVSLDADFLMEGPGRVRYSREFIDGRRVRANTEEINRLYMVEPQYSITGAMADHRLALKASDVGQVAAALASALGVAGAPAGQVSEAAAAWVAAAAEDLRAAGANGLVLAGEAQPPAVHALAHAINAATGAAGGTVEYTDPVAANPADQTAALRELAGELAGGNVAALIVIDSNPVFTAPADLGFAEAMGNARFKVVLGPYVDETAALADWFVPQAHLLESWSDLRAFDGTASIVQPLIQPLYGGRTPHELLSVILGEPQVNSYQAVVGFWQEQGGFGDDQDGFDRFFRGALNNGVVPDTALPARDVALAGNISYNLPAPVTGLELNFRHDPSIYDGRYANNGWLQELPKPITKLTWDNAAMVSPRTAIRLLGLAEAEDALSVDDDTLRQRNLERLQQANGSMVTIQHNGRTLEMPIWLVPGQADDTIVVTLGYGRSLAGLVGTGVGFNTYLLRGADAPFFGPAEATNANQTYNLVSTQDHWTMEGRHLVRVGVFEEFREDPSYIKKEIYLEEYGTTEGLDYQSLQPGYEYTGEYQWGMTIDLQACIGCNACVVACQAENNIPVVGKDQVAVGREMHWLRIDRYFAGADLDNPETYFQPMLCQHCEQAPCELVCPVAATVHDAEGLNNMVYNRCVGTKYCSNNCPYKVRRFNFLQYNDLTTESIKLMRNPQVTVRNRGVMEKCSFCVQRIANVRQQSKVQGNRPIQDGEVITACQQACPTQAIIFGDIKNGQTQVALSKTEPHNYTLLDELNTKPRTSYLARVRNPSAALAGEGSVEG